MDWGGLASLFGLGVKVVHRLPGRVRVHVPILKKIPADKQHIADQIIRLARLPNGVESVELRLITGNLLIQYDAKKLSENDVLGYLKGLLRIVSRVWDRLVAVPAAAFPAVVDRLAEVLRNALRQHVVLDEDVVIPDDVWTQT